MKERRAACGEKRDVRGERKGFVGTGRGGRKGGREGIRSAVWEKGKKKKRGKEGLCV